MGWGEPAGPKPCTCEGCDRDTLTSLRTNLADAQRVFDMAVEAFEWLLDAEQARADEMAAMLRSDGCYDPTDVLARHDVARADAR